MGAYDLKELMERRRRALVDEAEARKGDPYFQALERERIADEIAMGLRNADGEWLWADTPSSDEEEDETLQDEDEE
ncbi:hypothetical protein CcrC1_gp462 [Caulobacter phage C1]|nr:hypothetical protein CcrC1_gp462 [Caulobacter phage C1]UTU09769.1 hypothetical protein CcrBL47_gp485 [Caulobacter phage BL47]UTU10323.1 hypothetical protein CcrRB23_gp461 [Caulobacter phage RB23]WGN97876.1 hypothetical protein [Bertelyvirus sp.]